MALKTFTKNTGYVFIARIVATVLTSGSVIFLIRYLGPEQLGVYSFVITLLFLFGAFSDPGLSMYMTKEMAQNRNQIQELFSYHLSIQMLITLVVLLFLFCTAFCYPSSIVRNLLFIGVIGLIFNNCIFPFATVLAAMEDMKYHLINAFVGGACAVAITFIGIYCHFSLYYFMLLGILSSFSSFLIVLFLSRQYVQLEFLWRSEVIKKFILSSFPFFALTATGLLYTRIDLLMLKIMDSNQAAGLYNAAYKIIFFLFVIPISVRSAIYPMLSNYHKNKRDKLIFVTSKTIKYMLIISTLISIIIFLHADFVISLLFGDPFLVSAKCLKLLIWMFIPNCGYIVTMFYLNSGGQIKFVIKIAFIALVVNVLLNYLLIPYYSIFGAAIATIITEVIVFIGLMLKTGKEYEAVNRGHFFVKLFFIAVTGLFIALYIPNYCRGGFFICYFALFIYLFRIVDAEEKYVFRSIYKLIINKITGRKHQEQ